MKRTEHNTAIRRTTLAILAVFLFFLPAFLNITSTAAAPSFPDRYAGEDHWYDLSFMWFSNIAEGHFYLERGKKAGEYRAILDAETKGFLGWLTSYRKHRYISTMETIELKGEKRLRSRHFMRKVIKGDRIETTESIIDYDRGLVKTIETKHGSEPLISELRIPENLVYEDLLSAYFNLKGGIFGAIRNGTYLTIDTIPRKGMSKIRIKALEKDESAKLEKIDGAAFVFRVEVEKSFFGQTDGLVWVWTDAELVPIYGRVENVVGFGDVRGSLKTALPSTGK